MSKSECIARVQRIGFKLISGAYQRQGVRGIEIAELRETRTGWVFDTYA